MKQVADQHDEEVGPDRSVLTLIRGLQNGSLNPTSLMARDRRLCVEHLTAEGYSSAEIAEILKVADRTIARDRTAIRQSNSVEANPELLHQMVGALLKEADTCISRIRRAVRGNDGQACDKIEAEKTIWGIMRDLVQSLQRLGHLPTAPQMIHGHLSHHITAEDQPLEFGDLELEVDRVEKVLRDNQGTTEGNLAQEIAELKVSLRKFALEEKVQQIAQALPAPEELVDEQRGESEPLSEQPKNPPAQSRVTKRRTRNAGNPRVAQNPTESSSDA